MASGKRPVSSYHANTIILLLFEEQEGRSQKQQNGLEQSSNLTTKKVETMKPEEGDEKAAAEQEVEAGDDGDIKKKEEKEMSATDRCVEREYDSQQLANSLSTLTSSASNTQEAAAKAAIVLSQTDLQAVTEECELTKEQAESLLRKYNGDLKAALQAYIKGLGPLST